MRQAVLANVERLYPELKTRIDLRNIAVARKPGAATFDFGRSFTGLSSLAKRDVSHGHGILVVKVKVATLDKLVKGRPAFVKIDIEGAECDALCGASGALRNPPLISHLRRCGTSLQTRKGMDAQRICAPARKAV